MQTIWLSSTDFVTGDPSLAISYPFVGHPGTIVTCTQPGDLKWVAMGLRLPENVKIEEITLCYQVSHPQSFISQIRLTEMCEPNQALVIHDDPTDLNSIVPATYASNVGGKVPTPGKAVTLSLRLKFAGTGLGHQIRLGAVGITIKPISGNDVNVQDFGAKGDGKIAYDGQINAGSNVLTLTGLPGAVEPSDLQTTIMAVDPTGTMATLTLESSMPTPPEGTTIHWGICGKTQTAKGIMTANSKEVTIPSGPFIQEHVNGFARIEGAGPDSSMLCTTIIEVVPNSNSTQVELSEAASTSVDGGTVTLTWESGGVTQTMTIPGGGDMVASGNILTCASPFTQDDVGKPITVKGVGPQLTLSPPVSAQFTTTDVGKTISIEGAGAASTLCANIVKILGLTAVELSVAASTTVSGATVVCDACDNAGTFDQGTMTAGSTLLTVGSGTFAPGDVGKFIKVQGAGLTLALVTTIVTFDSPTQVALAQPTSTTVFEAIVAWGTDDANAIQAAIDAGGPGANVLFPSGTYMIDTLTPIRPANDSRLLMVGATLKALSNSETQGSSIIEINGRTNVCLSGGTLLGVKTGSLCTSANGVTLIGSTNVILKDMTVKECWMDGILLSGAPPCSGVKVLQCRIINNARTGIAITEGKDILIEGCEVTGTGGSEPQCGINVEVENGGSVSNIRIVGGRYANNKGHGIYLHPGGGGVYLREVRIEGVIVENNGIDNPTGRNSAIIVDQAEGVHIGGVRVIGHPEYGANGIHVASSCHVFVGHNRVEDTWRSIILAGASDATVIGNEVIGRYPEVGTPDAEALGHDQDGIIVRELYGPAESITVMGNRVRACNGMGIVGSGVGQLKVIGNNVDQSGQHGIYIRTCPDAIVTNNMVTASGLIPGSPQAWDDISLSHGSLRVNLIHNICRNDSCSPTVARAAIFLPLGGGDDGIISGNDLRESSGIEVSAHGVVIRGNDLRKSIRGLVVHGADEAVVAENDLRESLSGLKVECDSNTRVNITSNNLRGGTKGLEVFVDNGIQQAELVIISNDLRDNPEGLVVTNGNPILVLNLDGSGNNWNLT